MNLFKMIWTQIDPNLYCIWFELDDTRMEEVHLQKIFWRVSQARV